MIDRPDLFQHLDVKDLYVAAARDILLLISLSNDASSDITLVSLIERMVVNHEGCRVITVQMKHLGFLLADGQTPAVTCVIQGSCCSLKIICTRRYAGSIVSLEDLH